MIATILTSSPTFHAVAYNEAKLANGSARLLELKNFGPIDTFGYSSPEELTKFLMEYSSRNDRIKQPQFHLAISCKGHEYTEEQLVEFAHNYLKEMGYGDPNQPLLIYGHRDTDNTHIHIITSRVDPEGKKINDSNERRKSQKIIDKLMHTDLKAIAEKDINVAMQFDFRNVNQFKAVMEAMNYECYETDGKMCIKKGGMVQVKLEIEEIKKKAERNKLRHKNDAAENARLRAIFKKYRDTNTSSIGLEKDLKKLFGISLVYFGKKDSPYGYVAVDFNKKKVLEGGNIIGVKDLLDFRSPEQHMEDIEEIINQAFEQNPYISTKELNKRLRRLGTYIRKDAIVFGDIKKPIADSHRAILERNNKIEWRNGFKVQTEEERNLLCRLTGFDFPELVSYYPASNGRYYCKDHKELYDIFNINDLQDRREAFISAGYRIILENGSAYAYRPNTQSLTNLSNSGFDKADYECLLLSHNTEQRKDNSVRASQDKQQNNDKGLTRKPDLRSERGGSHYANREWEVGKRGYDRDDMDRNAGVSY